MCTTSNDGEINVWSTDTEELIMYLPKAPKTELRRPPSNYRRSASHRSMVQGPIPVDKLLFLRHRAKENMKFCVLISSEAGYLHCWSLYGERKDMGMFYGPSEASESILAMCTDATNRHLICGDTRGEIRVWNIEDYCCSTTCPIPFDSKNATADTFMASTRITDYFCEWTNYKGHGDFILTASTDHTPRLWTIKGEEIGIFGQRQQWDIELLLSARTTSENEQKEGKNENNNNENGQNAKSTITTNTNQLLVPDASITNEERRNRSLSGATDQLSEISLLSRTAASTTDRSTLSAYSTGLGLPIERGLQQQKSQRQVRRNRFGGITDRDLAKGGVCFTPFALLSTQDIDDAIANLNFHHKSTSLDDTHTDNSNDSSPTVTAPSKSRLVLPSVMSRRQSSLSLANNKTAATTTFDSETHTRFRFLSKQNSLMKSISEIL